MDMVESPQMDAYELPDTETLELFNQLCELATGLTNSLNFAVGLCARHQAQFSDEGDLSQALEILQRSANVTRQVSLVSLQLHAELLRRCLVPKGTDRAKAERMALG